MAKRLTKLRIDEVSAVDKGANNKRFLILKRAEEGTLFRSKHRSEAGQAGQSDGGQDMTADEVKQAVTEAAEEFLDPILKRLDDLEEIVAEHAEDEPEEEIVEKTEAEVPTADIAEIIADAVAKAVQPLADRVAEMEKVRGVRKSVDDTNGARESQSIFAGIF